MTGRQFHISMHIDGQEQQQSVITIQTHGIREGGRRRKGGGSGTLIFELARCNEHLLCPGSEHNTINVYVVS